MRLTKEEAELVLGWAPGNRDADLDAFSYMGRDMPPYLSDLGKKKTKSTWNSLIKKLKKIK